MSPAAERSPSPVVSSGTSLEVKPMKRYDPTLQDSPTRTESSGQCSLGETHNQNLGAASATSIQQSDSHSFNNSTHQHNALDEAIVEAKAVQDLVS